MHRVAGAEISEVRLRIEGRLGPHSAAAKRHGARVDPGFRPRLTRFRDDGKPPQKLAGVGRIRGDIAPAALVAAGRSDQDLVLDGERRRGMSGAGKAFDRGVDVEHHLSGILIDCNQPRVGAVPTGIDVHIVAEQRDAMQALGAALHFGIEFPDRFGLLVSDVEFPILLVLVAHVHEAVFDQGREILAALAGTTGVAERRHEFDFEVDDIGFVDLVQA